MNGSETYTDGMKTFTPEPDIAADNRLDIVLIYSVSRNAEFTAVRVIFIADSDSALSFNRDLRISD